MTATTKPTVVVFSDHLLYPSETFIRAQASALSKFRPVFAGSRRVKGLELPDEQVYTVNPGTHTGRLLEIPFKVFGFAPQLVKRLSLLDPVLLHAHYAGNGVRSMPLARRLGVPLIVTFHGSDATATDLRYQNANYGHRRYLANKRELQKNAAMMIAVSEFVRRKLLDQGFPEKKVIVHYTGIDTGTFQPAPTENSHAEHPIILFVGRLVERKGGEYLIRAASEVQKEMPEAEVIILGDGVLRAELESRAKSSLRRYQFLGARGPEEVRRWMNRAAVFCAPSVKIKSGEEEAFGMVYAEAQAMGKPVVAFDSGGISEVVSHGNTGFLAAERDWQTLAKYLVTLLRDATLRERFGREGRERVLRYFDLEQRTAILENIYTRVVEQHGMSSMPGTLVRAVNF